MTDRTTYRYPIKAWLGISIYLGVSIFCLLYIGIFVFGAADLVAASACIFGAFLMFFVWCSVLARMPTIVVDDNGVSARLLSVRRVDVAWRDVRLFKQEKPDAFGGRRKILYYSIYVQSERETSRSPKLRKVLSFSSAMGKLKFFVERMEEMSARYHFKTEL